MGINFSDKPQFTLKEVIYAATFVVSMTVYYMVDNYNDNVEIRELSQSFRTFAAEQSKDNEYSWNAIRGNSTDLKATNLMLRKMELELARHLAEENGKSN